MKHLPTIAAVIVWLAMVTVLVERQRPPAAPHLTSLPPAPRSAPSREAWFGIYQDALKIGHAHRIEASTPVGHRFTEETTLRLAMLGSVQRFTTSLVVDTDGAFALRGLRFALASAAGTFAVEGTSDGRSLEVRLGGQHKPTVIPLAAPLTLPEALRPRLAASRPAPGARYTAAVLNPLTLRDEVLTVTVEGYETVAGREALRITEEQEGLRGRAWLAEDGEVLREEGALGFVLVREPRETALAGMETSAPLDLPAAMRVPLDGTIANPRTLASLTLRVSGAAANRIPDDPPRQRLHDGILHIEREPPPQAAPRPGPEVAAWADPSPFIESDDQAIVARAGAIAGAVQDPRERARRLLDWMAENVVQEPRLKVPSAREVLASRRGDCNEHAVLLAALARAAGIPARVVAGLVYQGDGFYYHAWNELWLGRWVSADAIFRQMPVDATHVKLLVGGPERHLELAAVVGRIAFATAEPGS